MLTGKKIYFVSDVHLGMPDFYSSLEREKLLVRWLDEIKEDAQEIFLVGDIFDFWFEYKMAVPQGFTRLLGKLAELSDRNIMIHYFTGNHDLWINDYLGKETGVFMHYDKAIRKYNDKLFLIAHGDGLGPADKGYKRMKKIFKHPISKWLFERIHPNLGIKIGLFWSRKSREQEKPENLTFKGEDKEWLYLYAKKKLTEEHFDYFIFGHRHIPLDIPLGENSRFINLGDWITHFTYAVFDGETLELKKYV